MVFGHVETPAHQVAHLRLLAGIQDRTGGFTEFIAMPFVPAAAAVTAPAWSAGTFPGRPGGSRGRVHAVARLMLHGRIGNIQAAWPKYGLDASVDLLRGGANDLGGLLLDGRLAPDAGAEAGLVLTLDDVARVARELGRPLRQRTTGTARSSPVGDAARAGGSEARVDVLIVGAGFAGIGMGIQLARRGRESFVIIEQADDVGGTWRDNRYPGVSCDIPSHLYSFSFRPNPGWSRVFAEGREIHAYLRACVREEGLDEHLRLNCALSQAQWNDDDARWLVRTTRGDFSAASLVIATGRLSEPKIPPIKNLDGFGGRWWHSARWNAKVSLVGKRVGLVGTGASAIQILPRLAAEASEVVVFQRSAPYILPRGDREYSREEMERFAADPGTVTALRDELFAEAERGIGARQRRHPDIDLLRQRALDHLAASVPDPGLRRLLTPDYEIGCKRILFSDDYYAALQLGHVRLEPTPLARIADGSITGEGRKPHGGRGQRQQLRA